MTWICFLSLARESIGHCMQVILWHGYVWGEAAIPPGDAHHRALGAMAREALLAQGTCSTGGVDLTHHPLADPGWIFRLDHQAD